MDLTFLLRRREILGSPIPATPGIRWLRLMNILPKDLLDEVFLGFTANSCFLVSYVVRQGDFRLRFWLVPPDRSEPREYLRTPFAELSLEKRPTYAFLADACGIRFIQSMKDSETFIVLFSSVCCSCKYKQTTQKLISCLFSLAVYGARVVDMGHSTQPKLQNL